MLTIIIELIELQKSYPIRVLNNKKMLRSKTPNGNALRDLTNKIPPLKTAKFDVKDSDKIVLKKNKETQVINVDVEKKKAERKKLKDKKSQNRNNNGVPDIEYCPPPMEGYY